MNAHVIFDLASLRAAEPLVQRLGWTLVHSLWQGVLIAGALAAVLRLVLRSAPANIRYAAACAAMSMMVMAAMFTFIQVRVSAAAPRSPSHVLAALPASGEPNYIGPIAAVPPVSAPITLASSRDDAREAILRLMVIAWALGVTAMSLWHVGGWLWLRRLRRGAQLAQWQDVLRRLSDRVGIRRAVALVETIRIDVPAVIGVLRPVILVPAGIFSGLSPLQVEAILAHELAHVRRHDYLINLIQAAVETLMFYHPATWWISSQIRAERENCCDDIAAKICGDGGVYASALAALEERRGPGAGRIAVAATGGNLLARVRRVLNLPAPNAHRSGVRSLAAVALALACVALPMLVMAQQKPASEPAGAKLQLAGDIVSSSSSAAEPQSSPVRPEDLEEHVEDYRTGPGDLLSVSITDLVGPGVETVKQVRVSDTGIVSLPLVGTLKVSGLTLPEAEKAIAKAYNDAALMRNAQISVTALEPKQRTFNVLGVVDKPGQYPILKPNMRLIDALALASARSGELTQLRVIRAEVGGKQRVIDIPIDRLIAGDAGVNVVLHPGDTIVAAAAPKHFVKIVIGKETLFHDGKPIDWPGLHKLFDDMPEGQRRGTVLEIAAASPSVTVERYFNAQAQLSDLVKQYKLAYLSETGIQPTTEPAAHANMPEGTEAGEYYMTGVKRTGVYSLTGRKITLKQALIAAGGAEADPRVARITIIRRNGDEEKTVVSGLLVEDLTAGRAKDEYLRANDVVQVKPESTVAVLEIGALTKQLDDVEMALDSAKRKYGGQSSSVKELEATAQQLKARIAEVGGAPSASAGATTQSATTQP